MKASETNVNRLLQGAKVFIVPNFQRRYSWRLDEWQELWDDLMLECERTRSDSETGQVEGHFLGSVVLHPASGPASTLMKHLVIDGQQRLTTILVLLAALRDVRHASVPLWNPAAITDQYLINPYNPENRLRLLPTKFDREDFAETMDGRPTGAIGQAYEFFSDQLRKIAKAGADLQKICDTLLVNLVVVEINTAVGDSVNTIFNTLNSKGLPLTPADLIRNEMLLNLDEGDAQLAYENWWVPMERDLVRQGSRGKIDDKDFVSFFWAREVARQPGATKKNLFASFEQSLRGDLKPLRSTERQAVVKEIFKNIFLDHFAFLRVIGRESQGDDPFLPFDKPLQSALDDLGRWGSETYQPIALWVAKRVMMDGLAEDAAAEMLQMVLGFLVRRTLAGIPTNNLNRVLTPIPGQLDQDPGDALHTLREALSRKGSYWPNDAEVAEALPSRPLYVAVRRDQVRFILEAVERLLEAREQVEIDELTIEHVMPVSLPGQWVSDLASRGISVEQAEPLLHTVGNLTLTGYNSEMSNSAYAVKQQRLAASALQMNRTLSLSSVWGPEEIRERSAAIARVLCGWLSGPEHVMPETIERETLRREEMASALQSMPQGSWTTADELSRLIGSDLAMTRRFIQLLSPAVMRLIREQDFSLPNWLDGNISKEVEKQPVDDLTTFLTAEEIAVHVQASSADGTSGEINSGAESV